MSDSETNSDLGASDTPGERNSSGYRTGFILLAIGVMALLAPYLEWNRLFLLALGVGFLVWGAFQRNVGLIIPGGILTGLGLGVVVNGWLGPDAYRFNGDIDGAAFLLCFGAGWGLITLFSKLFTEETHWWPLIPGGILAAIGTALLTGGLLRRALEFVSDWWPLALIVLGAALLAKEWHSRHRSRG